MMGVKPHTMYAMVNEIHKQMKEKGVMKDDLEGVMNIAYSKEVQDVKKDMQSTKEIENEWSFEKDMIDNLRSICEEWGYLFQEVTRYEEGIRQDAGFPDLIITDRKGKVVFAELKSRETTVKTRQKMWIKALRKMYGFREKIGWAIHANAFIVRGEKGFQDLICFLQPGDYEGEKSAAHKRLVDMTTKELAGG